MTTTSNEARYNQLLDEAQSMGFAQVRKFMSDRKRNGEYVADINLQHPTKADLYKAYAETMMTITPNESVSEEIPCEDTTIIESVSEESDVKIVFYSEDIASDDDTSEESSCEMAAIGNPKFHTNDPMSLSNAAVVVFLIPFIIAVTIITLLTEMLEDALPLIDRLLEWGDRGYDRHLDCWHWIKGEYSWMVDSLDLFI